ncbi:MAG: extracellular solute-binding protein, partial [Oscillospiraceae bacterium]|nr:extracellular solute-binding protein [Oscillospiraceae bacterium]
SKTRESGPQDVRETIADIPEPDYDFGGYKFRALVNGDAFGDYRSREFFAPEETGDVINDAVYKRNITAEEKYNFTLEISGDTTWSNPAQTIAEKSIKSGDDAYDLVMPFMTAEAASNLAQQNLLLDLKALPGIDLENPWWDQRANEQLTIGNKLFFTTGDISIVLSSYCTFGILFNKSLVKDNSLEDPYALVKNGDWTIDKMHEMAKNITKDINGDGILNHEDQWGVLSELNASNGLFFAAGEQIVSKGADGYPEITMYNPRSVSVIEKALDFLQDGGTVIFANTMKVDSVWEYATKIMAEGRALFRSCALVGVEELRAAELDFGIIPYPKYDKAQNGYNNLVSTICVPGACVPTTVKSPETVGAIIEILARGAAATVTPAYFEQTLYNRLVRDDESYDMLKLIFSTRVYDLAYIYDWGGMGFLLMNMNDRGQKDFTSQYEKILDKTQAAMEKTIDLYKEFQ